MDIKSGSSGKKPNSDNCLSYNASVMEHICRFLEQGEIETCDLLFTGSNHVFFITIGLNDRVMKAIYKPCRGEAPLWDFPDGTLYKREYAAYVFSQMMEWYLVPPTVIRNGPYGVGSVQWFVDIKHRISYESQREKYLPQLKQVALFDYLVNNADRKVGHCLEGYDDRLWMVDHGLTFNAMPKLRTVIWDFIGQPVPDELVSDVITLQGKLDGDNSVRNTLSPLLDISEMQALEYRLQDIVDNPVFPFPESRWSIPWPWI